MLVWLPCLDIVDTMRMHAHALPLRGNPPHCLNALYIRVVAPRGP